MKIIWFKIFFVLIISVVFIYIFVNGIVINEQSVSGVGIVYVGCVLFVFDVSIIYGNLVGLFKLKCIEVSGGLVIVKVKDDISQVYSIVQGSNKGDLVLLVVVLFGYFFMLINEDFIFGLGIYVFYGIINDYENGFMGSFYGFYSKVQVIIVQLIIVWKINDKVFVGFGLIFNCIDGQLKNILVINGLFGSNGDIKINIKGDDIVIGYNVGVMVDLIDDIIWGLIYYFKVKYYLGGNIEVKNVLGVLGLNGKYDVKLDIILLELVDIFIIYKFDDKWMGYLGVVWICWSCLEKIEVCNSGVLVFGQVLGFNIIGEDLNWCDIWFFLVGIFYQVILEWVLCIGFVYELLLIFNEDCNVCILVGDCKVFIVGVGWLLNQDLIVDVVYVYLWEIIVGVNQEGSVLQLVYSVKYDNSVYGLIVQVIYCF